MSVTTVKRWVDAGVLPAHKTAGGHRKITRAEVLRAVHEGNFPRLDLSRLNFAANPAELNTENLTERLFDALRAGDIGRTRSVVHGAYAAGIAIEELGDPCTFHGVTLTQIAAFARTLHPRPCPPKRGRPTK